VASEAVIIDGSQGEGGGQILRTSLALSAALGIEVKVTNIRASRPKPGLAAQHLAAARAAAAVCNGRLQGDEIGSGEIHFRPGTPRSGRYRFDIGTAGSAALVCQTILPALALAEGESVVAVGGGTHNPLAPCFEYLRDVFGVLASAANIRAYFEMKRAGFYPAGGGELHMQVRGVGSRESIAPLQFTSRGELKYIEGLSAASSILPGGIVERQVTQTLGRLAQASRGATMQEAVWDSASPGTVVFLRVVYGRTVAGAFALGARGKAAERVADEAVDALLAFDGSDGVVDAHAADQLLTLAALCPFEVRFVTERVTPHLQTNAEVIRRLTGRDVTIDPQPGAAGTVIISPE